MCKLQIISHSEAISIEMILMITMMIIAKIRKKKRKKMNQL